MHAQGGQLKDEQGRTLMLRGVNLGGSSKVPYTPNGATYLTEGFCEHRNVSFVGRPFPLEEAEEHLARLRRWGFTFLRFLTPWEAIEHAGPGIYDEAYLDYVYQVIRKAGEHGMSVLIDPHQDVWSRFTGGDGAPGWTLEAVGFDISRLNETGAAITHQAHGDPFPRMIWPTNYTKLAAATMFTLFFGGADFAPKTTIDGLSAQEYLQSHYIHAITQVAQRLKDLPNVVGYDTLNEPSAGYIGASDVRAKIPWLLQKGESPTILHGMLLGAGVPQQVQVWDTAITGPKQVGSRLVNPRGVSVWREGYEDIWRQNGVWELDASGEPQVSRPDCFAQIDGRQVDFYRDYFRPFANRYAREIRSVAPEALIFVEGVPAGAHVTWGPDDAPNIVHAGHWYDGMTLFTKHFRSWLTSDVTSGKLVFGSRNVQRCFARQIAALMRVSHEQMNNAPTLIGEVGIPYDMRNRRAFRSGNWSTQIKALDATMRALEQNMVGFTLWNYTADNSNARGDQWNDEDLSIFSRDQQTGDGTLDDGGRALQAAVRPYACKVAGEPMRMSFDIKKRAFEFVFRHDAGVSAPTEVFVPQYQYPRGYSVQISDGSYTMDEAQQLLTYRHGAERSGHLLRLTPTA
jgi:hypothetical protein